MNINTYVKCYNKYRTVLKHIKKLLSEANNNERQRIMSHNGFKNSQNRTTAPRYSDYTSNRSDGYYSNYKHYHSNKTTAEDRNKRIDKDYGEYVETFREVYEENPSYYESPEAFRKHMPMTKENFVWINGGEEAWGPVYGIGEEVEEDNEELVAHYMLTLDGLMPCPPVVKLNNADEG